jgi:hypothetical protein
VRLTAWRYRCGQCGAAYELANADLSFSHGTFLAHSISGAVAIFDSVADPVFDEIQEMLDGDPRLGVLSAGERISLLHEVLPITFDPDPQGNVFVLNGSPGCRQCGSRSVADFTETREVVETVSPHVTHRAWSGRTKPERASAVRAHVNKLLDGA